ncbi:MAG: serine hydrolase domain-containing protein [Chitinophagales bacterium]
MKTKILSLLFIPLFSIAQTNLIDSISVDKIKMEGANPLHDLIIYVENDSANIILNKAYGAVANQTSDNFETIQYRVASSTKLFVSTIILQLIEEQKITLDNKAQHYLNQIDYLNFDNFHIFNNKKYASEITIEQLLLHRSGLADIFNDKTEDFFNILLQNTNRQYSPKSIVELYYQLDLNKMAHFPPNEGWHYSDMNYVLLGLIIENLDEKSLAASIRERILEPLEMKHTYFEFYEKPISAPLQINQYIGDINFTTINTSFDWSGGGLVSTNEDLSKYLKALFELKLINKESLAKMIDVKFTQINENRYGLGIYESEYNGKIFYGHYGFYGSYVGYCPEDGTIIAYCIGQATPDFSVYNYINTVLKSLKQ